MELAVCVFLKFESSTIDTFFELQSSKEVERETNIELSSFFERLAVLYWDWSSIWCCYILLISKKVPWNFIRTICELVSSVLKKKTNFWLLGFWCGSLTIWIWNKIALGVTQKFLIYLIWWKPYLYGNSPTVPSHNSFGPSPQVQKHVYRGWFFVHV